MVFARLALWFLGLVPLLAIGQSLPSPTFGTATATAHVSNTTRTASGSYTIPSATLNAMASKTTITGSIAKVAGYSPNDFKVVPYNGAAGLANGTLGNKGTTFALQTTMSCCSAGDIGDWRWSVIQRIDGSKIVVRAELSRGEDVERYEVPRWC